MKRTFNIKSLSFLLIFIVHHSALAQQETIRVMQYNILEYTNTGNGGSSFDRDNYFRTILETVAPDILTAEEISSQSNANYFLSDVLNSISTPNQYNIGTFVTNANNSSDNNAIYYKHSRFTFISAKQLTGYSYGNHPTYEYQLYNNLTGDKIYIYGVHLTSNKFGSAESQRNTEAGVINSMVNNLPSGSFYIASGDFNLYNGGNENAYSTLLTKFVEPLSLPTSSWTSSIYYKYYTLGTRKDGSLYGDTGGLQYKIDFIFNSQSIVDNGGIHYIGPFVTYGNDNGNHYQKSINASPTNTAVGQDMADALYNASDHLPVYADYTFSIPGIKNPPYQGSIAFTQVGVSDGSNPDEIEFVTLYRMNLTTLKITNNQVNSDGSLGNSGGTYDLSSTGWTDVPAGTHVRLGATLDNDNNSSDGLLVYNGGGSGTLPMFNTSGGNQVIAYTGTPGSPTYIAGLNWGASGWSSSSYAPGTASDLALGSNNNYYYSGGLTGTLYTDRTNLTDAGNWMGSNVWMDYNSQPTPVELSSFTGKISNGESELNWRTATEVNNYGFDIQRSLNKILWSTIGFVAGNGNSNSPKNYSYIDRSVPGGKVYYRLKQEDNDGKFVYSSTIELNNEVSPEVELSQNYPNPFNPVSTIEYSVPTAGLVTLKVYDVLGREVVTLVNGEQNAGKHSVKFNGANLASGI